MRGFIEDDQMSSGDLLEINVVANLGSGSVETFEVVDGTTVGEFFDEFVDGEENTNSSDYIIRVNGADGVSRETVLSASDEVIISYVGFAAG